MNADYHRPPFFVLSASMDIVLIVFGLAVSAFIALLSELLGVDKASV
jgi:hypothetical protein